MADAIAVGPPKLEKKPVKFSNLLCRSNEPSNGSIVVLISG